MKTTFVISHAPNPRINKRIEVAKAVGKVDLVYWDRDTVDIWDIQHTDIRNHRIKIKAEYTNPLKRIVPTLKFSYNAIKKIKEINPDVMHVANIDMLIVAAISKMILKNNSKIIYEIADLNQLVVDKQHTILKKTAKWMIINLEKMLIKNIDTLIVTSKKFYEEYYNTSISKEKVLFIPNMPDIKVFEKYRKIQKESFTIGFIGAIRYKNQMKMLIRAAEHCNVKVVFAGAGLDNEIKNLVGDKSFVQYVGKYNYNRDIASLYSKVDVVYSVYDADLKNVRIALPNKLYESVLCELPIIVAKNTYLSEIVEENNIGLSISHNNQQELEEAITKLSTNSEYYSSIVESNSNMKKMINMDIYNEKLKEVLTKI